MQNGIALLKPLAIRLRNAGLLHPFFTHEQETALEMTALKTAGCERIYREERSGGRWDRPELHRLLDQLRKGMCPSYGNSTAFPLVIIHAIKHVEMKHER
jgi:hypothetical protein